MSRLQLRTTVLCDTQVMVLVVVQLWKELVIYLRWSIRLAISLEILSCVPLCNAFSPNNLHYGSATSPWLSMN